jgi:hypothetical protein
VLGWSGDSAEKVRESIKTGGARIQRAARQIIDTLDGVDTETADEPVGELVGAA